MSIFLQQKFSLVLREMEGTEAINKILRTSCSLLFDSVRTTNRKPNFQWLKKWSFCLVFSHSVVSDSLQLHGLQHARLSCPSLSPGVCSNSCPLSRWCHPTISSSVVPFSSCLLYFPASGSFPMCRPFASGGQSIRASASALVLPMNTQGWFPLWLIAFRCSLMIRLVLVFE